jgi:hypothetical protein
VGRNEDFDEVALPVFAWTTNEMGMIFTSEYPALWSFCLITCGSSALFGSF